MRKVEGGLVLRMREKILHQECEVTGDLGPRPYVEVPTFGQYFKKNGPFDGRLFHSMDKITYTFISPNKEVISVHFDRTRRAIFYKGHNIDNISLTDEQYQHLTLFMQAMQDDHSTKNFVPTYSEVLQTKLKERGV